MCGLVGIWRRDGGEVDRSDLERMIATLGHRGPDGSGIWSNGHVGLAHVRLSIIDPSEASRQPFLTADGSSVLIYNGEVYNYRQMRGELERAGVQFRTLGDTEVVLQALQFWGPTQAVAKFNGMFSFAFFNVRDRTLWLSRDRIGIKPLVIADTGAELLFASEAKALLAHPHVSREVNQQALARWIIRGGRGSDQMLFSACTVLEPGSIWKITESGTEKYQYFHALTAVDIDRLTAASGKRPSDFVVDFANRLKKSVCLHLQSDVSLASMCSGGVDSSLVAAFAKQQLPTIEAYVADVAWSGGEGAQAEQVGRHLNLDVHRVPVDQERFLRLWPHTVWHSDTPPTHPSDAALLAVAQTCRAKGIKVLLTGEGSDELFGGYGWQRTTYDAWKEFESWRRLFVRRRPGSARVLADSLIPADVSLRNRLAIALETQSLLPQRFFELLRPIQPTADRAFLAHCFYSLYDNLAWILHRHDRVGMAASIEMRVPFLENEMFDFAFHLPRRAKLHRGTGKWLVKSAAEKFLPAHIVYARKRGFPMPMSFSRGTEKLLKDGRLADLMRWPCQFTNEVETLLRGGRYLRFHIVGLELWARIFFDNEQPDAVGEKLLAFANERRNSRNLKKGERRRRAVRGLPTRPGAMLLGRLGKLVTNASKSLHHRVKQSQRWLLRRT
jgi:asparagine synthase (glutamine-hydrolysing)